MKHLVQFIMLLVAVATLYFPMHALAQVSENRVKAMWVYTLIPYVKWPNTPNTTTICTRGLDGVYEALREIKKERKEATLIKEIGINQITEECHLLYIANSEESNIASILKQTSDKPILTVSSIYNFSGNAGIIEFIRSGNGVKLRINITAAQKSNLVINSDLLGVSEIVK